MRILCRVDYFWDDGVSRHGRGLVAVLRKFGEVGLIPPAPREPMSHDAAQLVARGRQMVQDGSADVSLNVQQAYEAQALPGARKIVAPVWESTRLPRNVLESFSRFDEIWVCSDWAAVTLRSMGIDSARIKVAPLGVDTSLFAPAPQTRRDRGSVFRFLSVGKWEPRKAQELLLQAYCNAFNANAPVELLMMVDNNHRPVDFQAVGRMLPQDAPPVRFLHGKVTNEQLVKLYNSADLFVLPTRAEGWGMPLMESMACGVPVLVTNYSSPTMFCTPDNSFLLNISGLEKLHDPHAYAHDADWGEWATPDVKHLTYLLRYAYEHQDEVANKGRQALADVHKHWTFDNLAWRYERLLFGDRKASTA